MHAARVHIWNHCSHCGAAPIEGARYECQTCPLGPDADYCARCHAEILAGRLAHPAPDNRHTAHLKGPHRFLRYEGTPSDDAAGWSDVPMPADLAPHVPDGFVVRPEFCAGYTSTFAGYAFVTTHPVDGRPLLMTALHVMDEMLRLKGIDAGPDNPAYTGRELPAQITGVNLYDVFAPNWMTAQIGRAGAMHVLPETRIKDPEPKADRDLAAFDIPDASGLTPRPPAPRPPDPGAPVWLAATRGQGRGPRCFKAVVVARDAERFIFRFAEAQDGPPFTSGAPILDADGAVVAVNVGGGRWAGDRYGHGCHVGAIHRHLTGVPA